MNQNQDERPILKLTMFRADMVGKMFKLSVKDNYDSLHFAKQVLTSDYGRMVLQDGRLNEYSAYTFLYSGFKRELQFKKGKTYDEFFMWFAGFLYKYWVDIKEVDPLYLHEICPLDKLYTRFDFYHTQGWNYIIADIMDNPFV